MKRYLKKIKTEILKKLLGDGEIQARVKKALENLEIEETKECQHNRLVKVIPKDFWYRCTKCKMIIMITDSVGWNKKQIPILIENLKKGLKL